MTDRKMTMGVIVGNRNFFPALLAKSGREDIIRVLAEKGYDSVVLTPEDSRYGVVETFEDSKRCAALFKANRDRIDGVIVTLPNFGDERAIANTLRLAELGVPVLVQATPDTAGKMTIQYRRDSFCGKMSACNNLRQYGIPYSLTKLHTESLDSQEFAADLDQFAATCRIVKGLKNLRVGSIGARPAAFNTVRFSEKILEANGISIETVDLSDIMGRIGKLKDDHAGVRQKLDEIRAYTATGGVPDVALVKMAKLGFVIDDWMRETEVKISAIQCWTAMEEYFGVVPCAVMSMMSNNLTSSACEVDICGAIAMHALALASQTPSALLDWNNNYGDDPNKAVCFHCSNLPKHFFEKTQDGLPGDPRRNGRQGEDLRHAGRPGEGERDELRPLLDRRRLRPDARLRRQRRLHRRSAGDFRRHRRGGDSRSAAPAALHLREWVRAPRRRQPVEFGRGGA